MSHHRPPLSSQRHFFSTFAPSSHSDYATSRSRSSLHRYRDRGEESGQDADPGYHPGAIPRCAPTPSLLTGDEYNNLRSTRSRLLDSYPGHGQRFTTAPGFDDGYPYPYPYPYPGFEGLGAPGSEFSGFYQQPRPAPQPWTFPNVSEPWTFPTFPATSPSLPPPPSANATPNLIPTPAQHFFPPLLTPSSDPASPDPAMWIGTAYLYPACALQLGHAYVGAFDKNGTCLYCKAAFLDYREGVLRQMIDDAEELVFGEWLGRWVPWLSLPFQEQEIDSLGVEDGDEEDEDEEEVEGRDEWELTAKKYFEKYFGNQSEEEDGYWGDEDEDEDEDEESEMSLFDDSRFDSNLDQTEAEAPTETERGRSRYRSKSEEKAEEWDKERLSYADYVEKYGYGSRSRSHKSSSVPRTTSSAFLSYGKKNPKQKYTSRCCASCQKSYPDNFSAPASNKSKSFTEPCVVCGNKDCEIGDPFQGLKGNEKGKSNLICSHSSCPICDDARTPTRTPPASPSPKKGKNSG